MIITEYNTSPYLRKTYVQNAPTGIGHVNVGIIAIFVWNFQ